MSIRSDLIRDEGFVPHAYRDHLGFWTIGYGFLIDERRGGRIPKEVADFWLDHEIEQRWSALARALPWLADEPEPIRRALQNMAYQLGIGGLLNFRRMIAALQAGNYVEAARQALDSTWARQTPNRAARVAALIRNTTPTD